MSLAVETTKSRQPSQLSALCVLVVLCFSTRTFAQMAAQTAVTNGSRVRLIGQQYLVGLLNPMGAEHHLELGVRADFADGSDSLWDNAHFAAGVTSFVSPVYAITGGYLELQPFSFLVLRGQVTGVSVWPIGMNGAGHYGVDGYLADVSNQALPANLGGSAVGLSAQGSVTLQGALDLDAGTRLVFQSEATFVREVLGDAPFYYSMKYDLVLAQTDFLVTNSAFLGVDVRVNRDLLLRVGAYDDLRHVPSSGYVGHQTGALLMFEWQRVHPHVSALSVFVRGGAFTHHVLRAGQPTVLAGIAIDYDFR